MRHIDDGLREVRIMGEERSALVVFRIGTRETYELNPTQMASLLSRRQIVERQWQRADRGVEDLTENGGLLNEAQSQAFIEELIEQPNILDQVSETVLSTVSVPAHINAMSFADIEQEVEEMKLNPENEPTTSDLSMEEWAALVLENTHVTPAELVEDVEAIRSLFGPENEHMNMAVLENAEVRNKIVSQLLQLVWNYEDYTYRQNEEMATMNKELLDAAAFKKSLMPTPRKITLRRKQ
jgi:hypothetical protein